MRDWFRRYWRRYRCVVLDEHEHHYSLPGVTPLFPVECEHCHELFYMRNPNVHR